MIKYFVRYSEEQCGWLVVEESGDPWCIVVSGPHATEYLANNRKRYREVMQEAKCQSTK